jgi:hypothetical protein
MCIETISCHLLFDRVVRFSIVHCEQMVVKPNDEILEPLRKMSVDEFEKSGTDGVVYSYLYYVLN